MVRPRLAEACVPRSRSVLRANWFCRSNAAIAAVMITVPTAAATINSNSVKPRRGSVRADIGALCDGDRVSPSAGRGDDLHGEEQGRDGGAAGSQLGGGEGPGWAGRTGGVHDGDGH